MRPRLDKLSDMNTKSNTTTHRLRIALVTETWPPEINGVSHSVAQLVKALRQTGHVVQLIRPRQDTDSVRSQNHQEVLTRAFRIPRYPSLQGGWPAYWQVYTAFKRIQPDVVHIVTEGPLGLAALLAAQPLKLPISSGFHSPFHEFSNHFGMKWLTPAVVHYLRWFHNQCDLTCVPSAQTQAQLTALGFQGPFEVVGRGVDTVHFSPDFRSEALRQQWQANDDTTVLLYVGRLSPEKRIDQVIEAYRALQRAQPARSLQLVLVGDGPDRARLEQLAPDAWFAGMQTGASLAAHYASADVFCFASQVETYGNVVPEAMASGLPILAYALASAALLVESGQTGWLAPPQRTNLFLTQASALPPLAELKQAGQRARARVASLGWAQPAQIWAQALASLTSPSSSSHQVAGART